MLPVTLRVAKDNGLVDIIWTLSTFMKELCTKELTIEKLDEAGANVVITLCRMEKFFYLVFSLFWCI